jgi:hypothetical protein
LAEIKPIYGLFGFLFSSIRFEKSAVEIKKQTFFAQRTSFRALTLLAANFFFPFDLLFIFPFKLRLMWHNYQNQAPKWQQKSANLLSSLRI